MNTIALPKTFAKNTNLVAVPRNIYEEFLAWQKQSKSQRTFKASPSEKKALARARKNFSRGNYVTFSKLHHELERRRR